MTSFLLLTEPDNTYLLLYVESAEMIIEGEVN